jgi:hypothetical protein
MVIEHVKKYAPPMAAPTDAAVATLAGEMRGAAFREVGYWSLPDEAWIAAARHVLTRQPGPEDVERIADVIHVAWNKSHDSKFGVCLGDIQRAQARAILALYAPPPEFRLDKWIAYGTQKLHADLDIANVRIATLESELAAATPPVGTIRLGEGLTEAVIQELLLQTAEATHDLACAVSDSMAPQAASDIGDVRTRLQFVINKLADMDEPHASATPKPDPRLDVVFKALRAATGGRMGERAASPDQRWHAADERSGDGDRGEGVCPIHDPLARGKSWQVEEVAMTTLTILTAARELPRCGDHVLHTPSGETWLVAWAEGDDLSWTGWPNGIARVQDCTVTKRCTDEEHARAVQAWADVTDDSRRGRVLRLYGAAIEKARADG